MKRSAVDREGSARIFRDPVGRLVAVGSPVDDGECASVYRGIGLDAGLAVRSGHGNIAFGPRFFVHIDFYNGIFQ